MQLRRVCPACGKMTPVKEKRCSHCHAAVSSDMSWKIPLIIGIFLAAFILSVVVHIIAQ